jgi:hypothetical protein
VSFQQFKKVNKIGSANPAPRKLPIKYKKSVEAAHLDIHTGGGKVHGRTTEGLGVCMEVVKHNGVENDRGMESSGRAVK